MYIWIGIILFILVIIALAYFTLTYCIDRVLFVPVTEHVWKPEQNYSDVYFGSRRLNGWLIKSQDKKRSGKVVLFCHGNTGNISHRRYIAELSQLIHVDVFLFDYQGYGRSPGHSTLSSICQDTHEAYKYLRSIGYSSDDIIVWGESIGGYPAIYIAQKEEVSHLLLIATFANLGLLARESGNPIAKLASPLLDQMAESNTKRISQVKAPVLLIHSTQDEIIPYHHSQKLFEAISHNKKKHITITGGHGTPRLTEDIINQLTDFCHLEQVNDPRCLEILDYIAEEKVKHGR